MNLLICLGIALVAEKPDIAKIQTPPPPPLQYLGMSLVLNVQEPVTLRTFRARQIGTQIEEIVWQANRYHARQITFYRELQKPREAFTFVRKGKKVSVSEINSFFSKKPSLGRKGDVIVRLESLSVANESDGLFFDIDQ